MAVVNANEAATKLCEVMGLDAGKVTRIVLDFDAKEPFVGVHIQYIGDEEVLNVIFDIAREAQGE